MSRAETSLRITSHDYEWHPKFFGVVCGLFCGLYMISIALGSKLIDVHGLILPAGIVVFPICCILTDVLTEIYGFNRTRQAIWTALVCTMLFAALSQLAVALPPAQGWEHQAAFESLFSQSARIAVAGAMAWCVGEFSNTFVMSRMKVLQKASYMPVRFVLSTFVGQGLDTTVFTLVAFAGLVEWGTLGVMILSGWFAKVAYEIVALPLTIPITHRIKRLEGVEHFDRQKLRLL